MATRRISPGMMSPRTPVAVVLAALMALVTLASPAPAAAQAAPLAGAAAAADDELPLAIDDLESLTAGVATSIITIQRVTGAVSDVSITADEITNGDITLDNNALRDFGGIGSFVMNTGNANTLQSVVSVTVATSPGTSP